MVAQYALLVAQRVNIMGCFSMKGRLDDYKWAGPYMVSNQVVAVNENSGGAASPQRSHPRDGRTSPGI